MPPLWDSCQTDIKRVTTMEAMALGPGGDELTLCNTVIAPMRLGGERELNAEFRLLEIRRPIFKVGRLSQEGVGVKLSQGGGSFCHRVRRVASQQQGNICAVQGQHLEVARELAPVEAVETQELGEGGDSARIAVGQQEALEACGCRRNASVAVFERANTGGERDMLVDAYE